MPVDYELHILRSSCTYATIARNDFEKQKRCPSLHFSVLQMRAQSNDLQILSTPSLQSLIRWPTIVPSTLQFHLLQLCLFTHSSSYVLHSAAALSEVRFCFYKELMTSSATLLLRYRRHPGSSRMINPAAALSNCNTFFKVRHLLPSWFHRHLAHTFFHPTIDSITRIGKSTAWRLTRFCRNSVLLHTSTSIQT